MESGRRKGLCSCECPAFRNRSLFVDVLSIVYGCGSWTAMTGLWIELPLLVQRLPEGWKIASRLTLALQVANVGPVIYGVLNRFFPALVNERSGTHVQLAIGTMSTLMMIFFWSSTVAIGGSQVCLALYVLSFGLSVVDCTSSVVFLPYMANFKPIYLIPYLAGEGLSGLLPSIVGSIQGIDKEQCINETVGRPSANGTLPNDTEYVTVRRVGEPRFDPEWFFGFLLVMVLLSWLAFCLMDRLSICRAEMLTSQKSVRRSEFLEMTSSSSCEILSVDNEAYLSDVGGSEGRSCTVAYSRHPVSAYYYLLFLQGWASIATFGVFPAVQTYSCLPYGDGAFHAAVILGGAAYPISCIVAMFVEVKRMVHLSVLTVMATGVSIFLMYAAATSPDPPLAHWASGPSVIVVSWVVFVWTFSYVKTMATAVVGEHWGQRGLFWIGAVTQGGAAVGAVVMFVLVNVMELFHESDPCTMSAGHSGFTRG